MSVTGQFNDIVIIVTCGQPRENNIVTCEKATYLTGSLAKKMESEELPQYAALCSMAMAK